MIYKISEPVEKLKIELLNSIQEYFNNNNIEEIELYKSIGISTFDISFNRVSLTKLKCFYKFEYESLDLPTCTIEELDEINQSIQNKQFEKIK